MYLGVYMPVGYLKYTQISECGCHKPQLPSEAHDVISRFYRAQDLRDGGIACGK